MLSTKLNKNLISKKLNPTPDKIVIPQYNGIYYPIAKVACSSIKFALSESMGLGIPKEKIHQHFRATKEIAEETMKTNYKFSFVRNPFDRILSAYKSKIQDDPNINNHQVTNGVQKILARLYGDTFYGGMYFKDYLKAVAEIPDRYADEHFRAQYAFLFDENGKQTVDFIGRFESLSNDYTSVATKLNFPQKELAHFGNFTPHKHYSAYFDEEMVEIVSKRYAKDIEMFGYKYENVIKTVEDPKVRVKVDFNKEEKVLEFDFSKRYGHYNKGWVFVHIMVNGQEKPDRANMNWHEIRRKWTEENGNYKWTSKVLDYNFSEVSKIVVGQKLPDSKHLIWHKVFQDF